MTTFLLCWYALGWAAIGLLTSQLTYISICMVFWILLSGGLGFTIGLIVWVEANEPICPVVWRRK